MTIAITAASSRLGRAVIEALHAADTDETIIGLARTPENAQDLGVDIRPGDYDDPDQLVESLRGVDTVMLIPGVNPPEDRIQQHRNVINAATQAGVTKIVFSSIIGAGNHDTEFSPATSSYQTEQDIAASGLDYLIGRNGMYIEPDVEAVEDYLVEGVVRNSADAGSAAYTTRSELAAAYAALLTNPELTNATYRLHGDQLTQTQLVDYLNQAFGTELTYEPMSVEDFLADRTAALGDYLGPIISAIYQDMRLGGHEGKSDYRTVTGRDHITWDQFFTSLTQPTSD